MRTRALPFILATLVGLFPVAAGDLPEAPDGFAWRDVPELQGALLVPDGWHFRTEAHKGTLALFITENDFSPPDKYAVGVSVNAFLDHAGATDAVRQHLTAQATTYSVELTEGGFGPFSTLQCQYDIPATDEHEANRVFYLGVSNPETEAAYLVMFEAPVDQWKRTWGTGNTILENLALSGSR